MKKRNRNLVVSLTLSTLLLAGCSANQEARLDTIGTEEAKAVALQDAGLADEDVIFTSLELDSRNGQKYYEIDFSADGFEYEYDIDTLTGVVIEGKKPVVLEAKEEVKAEVNEEVKKEEASAEEKTEVIETVVKEEPKVTENNKAGQDTSNEPTLISEASAQEIAMGHAGVSIDAVTFVKCGLDWDDGRRIYDVEFYGTNYVEYDYDIDAITGDVLDFDYDAEYYTPPVVDNSAEESKNTNKNTGSNANNETSASGITEQQAKDLALSQVPGATADNIRSFEVDYDDGRVAYEGTIVYEEMEYDFEIDGYSGAIREWDVESIYD